MLYFLSFRLPTGFSIWEFTRKGLQCRLGAVDHHNVEILDIQ